MGTRTAAGIANVAYYFTFFNSHPLPYGHPGQMGKTSSQAAAMIYFYVITVLLIISTKNYKSICRRNYFFAKSG